MHHFSYVPKKEAAPYKEKVIELINAVQDEVRDYFTFRFDFVGSSSRNMITCERNGNIGYDFDVNIEPNDPEKEYSPEEIRTIIFNAFKKHMRRPLQFRNYFERLCSYVPDRTGESGSGNGRSVQLSSAGYNNIKQECPLKIRNSGQTLFSV